jgi:hypothetical protein
VIAAHVNDVSGGDAVADTPDENELLEKGSIDTNDVGNSKAKSSDAAKLQVSGCVGVGQTVISLEIKSLGWYETELNFVLTCAVSRMESLDPKCLHLGTNLTQSC